MVIGHTQDGSGRVQACTVGNGATDLPKQELDTVQLAKQAMGTLLSTHVTAHMIRQVWHAAGQMSPTSPPPRCRPIRRPSSSARSCSTSSRGSRSWWSSRDGGGVDARAGRARSDPTHRSSVQAAASFRAEEEAIANSQVLLLLLLLSVAIRWRRWFLITM
jgi:hypothetical protein